MKRGFVLSVGLIGLGLPGCVGVPDYVKNNDADVFIRIVSINNESALRSDVFEPPADPQLLGVDPDFTVVAVANRLKNPLGNTSTIVANAVFFERYEVRYLRSDGRSTEGVDVPFRITGPLSGVVDVATTGGAISLNIEVVRAQAKLEAPLRNLRASDANLNVAPPGGALVLSCIAEITVYGRTVSGQAVSATGRLQIDFADWQ